MQSTTKFQRLTQKAADLLEYEAIIAGNSGERQFRREAIMHNKQFLRKLGALSVHYLTPIIGSPIRERLLARYRQNGYQLLGAGNQSSVLRTIDGDTVVKLVRSSSFGSASDRRAQAAKLQALIQATTICHKSEALATTVEADYVITGRQPRTYTALVQSFVEGHCAFGEPAARSGLRQFAERSLDVMVPAGLAPDVIGQKNILSTDDGALVLIDTVPLQEADSITDRGGGYRRNLERLHLMAHLRP